MALRKLQTIVDAAHSGFAVAIYRDSEWNEFRARLIVNGVALPDSDAFADTKDDAIRTGNAMIQHAARERDKAAVIAETAGIVTEARAIVDANQLPATVCWVDGLCLRSAFTESAFRFGIVTVLPRNYFN